MEFFKTVPAYTWLFIYFRKYRDLRKTIKPVKKLSRRHLINSFDEWLIKGLTVHEFYLLTYPTFQENMILLQLVRNSHRSLDFS